MNILKNVLSIGAGMACLLFLGYCVYFDKKRHNDPNFKKKLHARRLEAKQTEKTSMHNLYDHINNDIERYFILQIALGEHFIVNENYERGVKHLTNALLVCSQRARIIQVLHNTLPGKVFDMLAKRMQEKCIPYHQIYGKFNNKEIDETAKLILEYTSAAAIVYDLDRFHLV